jgi:hypothetical protein
VTCYYLRSLLTGGERFSEQGDGGCTYDVTTSTCTKHNLHGREIDRTRDGARLDCGTAGERSGTNENVGPGFWRRVP